MYQAESDETYSERNVYVVKRTVKLSVLFRKVLKCGGKGADDRKPRRDKAEQNNYFSLNKTENSMAWEGQKIREGKYPSSLFTITYYFPKIGPDFSEEWIVNSE